MIRNQNLINRLYLSQGDEDVIFIDNKVPQHNIDGIRFLYKQFKRRKNGVILNDPFSFSRNIQICLFLKAVRPLLHRPVLILCQEGSEQEWYDRFDTWTNQNLLNEVAIETVNPFIQKMIMINTMVNLHLFCAREWSIIIVDGDNVTTPNPILKLPFRACFKIWNTSVNMKENLDRFEEVYKWLFPREIFEKHYFIPDYDNAVDVIEKSIMLDSLFEDVVLRRDDLLPSFENYIQDRDIPQPMQCETTMTAVGPKPSSTTISVRGHDATSATSAAEKSFLMLGNKILARTSAVPTNVTGTEEVTMIVGDTTIARATVPPTRLDPQVTVVGDTTIARTTVAPTTSHLPIVTISKKNKDATGTKIKRSKTRIDSGTANKTFDAPIAVLSKLIEESPKTTDGGTFDRSVDFSIENYEKKNSQDNGQQQSNTETIEDKTKKDKNFEIIEIDKEPDTTAQTSGSKLVEMDTLVFGHDTLISKVDTDSPEKGLDTVTGKKETEPHTILTCKPVGEHSSHHKLFTDNKKSTSTITSKPSCSDNTERDNKNDRKILKSISKISTDKPEGIIKINLDELNREMRDLGTKDNPEKLTKRQKIADTTPNSAYGEIKQRFKELNKEASASGTKDNTEQVANSLKRNNIDVKMKECEETVSKKFKGSLLDSLF